ncbi:MAG: GNAT family N-acetyltransferase [Lachnospiraceae bacterium]|nr:GNAT family N-acetyltransferase [Lachnospiraceae bacterium]
MPQIMQFYSGAINKMKEEGIDQWDERYPNEEDFEEDIKKEQLYVGETDQGFASVFVLNQEYDEEYANGEWKEDIFYVVHRLCVNATMQAMGIGSKTMDYLENLAAERGAGSIRLDVFSQNKQALRMYEKRGFEKTGEVHWRKGMFYLMEKKIK